MNVSMILQNKNPVFAVAVSLNREHFAMTMILKLLMTVFKVTAHAPVIRWIAQAFRMEPQTWTIVEIVLEAHPERSHAFKIAGVNGADQLRSIIAEIAWAGTRDRSPAFRIATAIGVEQLRSTIAGIA